MATLPPNIHTYHCICNSILLASTHKLSNLPRRQGTSLDEAVILPLPPATSISDSTDLEGEQDNESMKDMEPEGYTILLSLVQDKKVTIIRREDGFEKRLLSRCGRCNLAVGYEIVGEGTAMDVDGKGKEAKWFEGKIMYLLPGGLMSTETMNGEEKPGQEDVNIRRGGVPVFE